jgi:hypothetical protein
MAEPYSDEEFLRWSEMMPSEAEENSLAARWAATVRRLMAERDVLAEFAKGWPDAVEENDRLRAERNKARRVAKVLAGPAKHLKVLGHDLTADELKAIDTALAYPGREP